MLALEKRMRVRLENERELLCEELEHLRRDAREQDLERSGDNTPLSEVVDQIQVGLSEEARVEQLGRLMVRLASLDDALARLERGEYGFCAACGTPLTRKRLEALPEASLCISCKWEAEEDVPRREHHAGAPEPAPAQERETENEK